jgi:uncharacterized RDD family membrane protein YckC
MAGESDTPAAEALEPAGWWRRTAALSLDSALINLAVWLPTLLVIGASIAGREVKGGNEALMWILGALAVSKLITWLVFWGLYMPLASSRRGSANGQSLGKQLFEIRVVRDDGQPLSRADAYRREALWKGLVLWGVGLLLLFPYAADVLAPLRDARKRALHDRLSGTAVIRSSRPRRT